MRYFNSQGIKFPDISLKCCVCFIDLVDSTKNTIMLYGSEIREYYSIFINSVSEVAKKYNAKVIKNVGDSVLFYFPKTSDSSKTVSFEEVLKCVFEISENRHKVNKKLLDSNLPVFNYRISLDYGLIELALTGDYHQVDIFGPIVNLCAKINSKSCKNEIIIGQNFFRILRSHSIVFERSYEFINSGEYTISENNNYCTYVIRKRLFDDESMSSNNRNILSSPYSQQRKVSIFNLNRENQYIYENTEKLKKIILVDDNPDALLTWKLFLQDYNYDVVSFTDPDKALVYVLTNPTDNVLVILDIRMGKLNGFQLYQKLRNVDPMLKFLFITAVDIADETWTLLPNISKDQIYKKPIDKKTFKKAVEKMLYN